MCKLYTFGLTEFVYIVPMKILITGGNGFLGQHLCKRMAGSFSVIAAGRGERRVGTSGVGYYQMDISLMRSVKEVLDAVEPDVIVHTAAMSKPDECNSDKAKCISVNVDGTANLVNAAGVLDKPVHFIYVSSDFVLGEGGPHGEEAIPAPLNFYGESKLMAEQAVLKSSLVSAIVRPVFMYGETWQGMRPTFLHWIKESLENGRRISVVNDQHRTPTYAGDVCKGIEAIIERKAAGLYHLGGTEVLTPYEMAAGLASHLGLNGSLISPVDGTTFKEPVQRAKQGGVLIKKARKDLDFEPVNFREGLQYSFPTVA